MLNLPPVEKWMGGHYLPPLIWFSETVTGGGELCSTRRFYLRKVVGCLCSQLGTVLSAFSALLVQNSELKYQKKQLPYGKFINFAGPVPKNVPFILSIDNS